MVRSCGKNWHEFQIEEVHADSGGHLLNVLLENNGSVWGGVWQRIARGRLFPPLVTDRSLISPPVRSTGLSDCMQECGFLKNPPLLRVFASFLLETSGKMQNKPEAPHSHSSFFPQPCGCSNENLQNQKFIERNIEIKAACAETSHFFARPQKSKVAHFIKGPMIPLSLLLRSPSRLWLNAKIRFLAPPDWNQMAFL